MTSNQPDRLSRMENVLERTIDVQSSIQLTQARHESYFEILVKNAVKHDAMISRLDRLIEYLISEKGMNPEPPEERQ